MANKGNGKDFKLYIGAVGSGTLIAHGTDLTWNRTRSTVDVTDKDSSGNKELLSSGGIFEGSVTMTGIMNDDSSLDTLDTSQKSGATATYYVKYPIFNSANSSPRTDEFSAILTEFTDNGVVAGEATYSLTFEISGSITRTAEAL